MTEPTNPQAQPAPAPITTDESHKAGTRAFRNYEAYTNELKATASLMSAPANAVADALARNLDPQAFAVEYSRQNPPTPLSNANEKRTMDDKDKPRYSLARAVQLLSQGKAVDGLELEVHQQILANVGPERAAKMQSGALLVPSDIYGQRAANVGTTTAGGFTVQSTVQGYIDELTNATALDKLGVNVLNGLTGNLLFPVLSSGTTAYWVAEGAAIADSQPVWAQKSMTPHRVGSNVPFSTQLLAQSSYAIESVMRNVLVRHIDLAEDLAGLEGTGSGGQPTGIKNTSGINATVTFGGTAEWADIVEFETGVNVDNADGSTMAFVIDAATVGKWKTVLKVATYGGTGYLIGDNNLINGYRYLRSNQVSTSHYAYFGDFSKLTKGRWAADELVVDPYARKKYGEVEICLSRFVDFLVTQPLAFNVSTDSAAA